MAKAEIFSGNCGMNTTVEATMEGKVSGDYPQVGGMKKTLPRDGKVGVRAPQPQGAEFS